jgi:hypothetical protein
LSPSNENKISRGWATASFATQVDVEVMWKLLIRTASGWLERLVRRIQFSEA